MRSIYTQVAFIIIFSLVTEKIMAQQAKGVIMIVQIINKEHDEHADTLAKIWSKGAVMKLWVYHKEMNLIISNDSIKNMDVPSNRKTVKQFSSESFHKEYVRDLDTGESLDIIYNKNGTAVWKRIEKPVPVKESVDEIWADERKKIAGHLCQKLILINRTTKLKDTMFVATDLPEIRHPQFRYIDYFPMEYEDQENRYLVKEIKATDLSRDIFTVPPGSKVFNDHNKWIEYLIKSTK